MKLIKVKEIENLKIKKNTCFHEVSLNMPFPANLNCIDSGRSHPILFTENIKKHFYRFLSDDKPEIPFGLLIDKTELDPPLGKDVLLLVSSKE
ncbi:MAG: hypothetical protein LBQ88_04065 [Treponema sp.]|nr:hypothetical protein [Treponema sp.]